MRSDETTGGAGAGTAAGASLQDAKQELTRERIVSAVRGLLAEGNPGALSTVAVAERAGVSRRTVYRHFPTKDALVEAAAQLDDDRSRGEIGGRLLAFDDPTTFLLDVWPDLARDIEANLAANRTPAGREVRRRRIAERRVVIERALAERGLDPTTEAGRELVALVLLLTSSSSMVELVDIQGLTPDEAARTAGRALQLVIDSKKEST